VGVVGWNYWKENKENVGGVSGLAVFFESRENCKERIENGW